ncbi:MAG: caspase domain-containing protein [Bacteroidales bacterium]
MKKTLPLIIIILLIGFSKKQAFCQSYDETIKTGLQYINQNQLNEALSLFEEELNYSVTKSDHIKRSTIYFYIAYTKYKMNNQKYINDLNTALIINGLNANALFLKSIYLKNENSKGQMKQYLKAALREETFTNQLFATEIDAYNLIEECNQIIKELKPSLINCFTNPCIIKKYVENKINTWQKKGRYEKTDDYKARVNEESRNKMIEVFTQQAIDSLGNTQIKLAMNNVEYDADNESFKIVFKNNSSIVVKVPINEAPAFDENLAKISIKNKRFTLNKNNDFAVLHMEFNNPVNNKTYIYDSKDEVAFSSTSLNLQFDEIEISLPDEKVATNQNLGNVNQISVGKSDIDINIPETDRKKINTFVLAIGNEDYTKYQNDLKAESNVLYARNDATSFAKYAEKTLGIPNENITLITDAIGSQIKREIIRLTSKAKYGNGDVEIIFYFSGHGFPDIETQESYIMPVDISSTTVKDGIKLSQLYNDLAEFPTKKTTVILDACFSGGGRNQGLLAAKAVKIRPKEEMLNKGNLVVFAASSGDQASLFYNEKQHGMFTYFLLKKLQETKGDITYGEMANYLIKIIPLTSSDINYKEQNPQVNVGKTVEGVWESWKF